MAKQINFKDCLTISDYNDLLVKLDMQEGECYAVFKENHKLDYMWVIVEKDYGKKYRVSPSFGVIYRADMFVAFSSGGGLLRDEFIDAEYIYKERRYWTYIVQVDRKWFDKISKSIAIFNSVLDACQVELKKLIEE